MTDEFRDPFSEEELQRMLGGGDPTAARFREFTAALWRFFEGPHNEMLGDARTVGFFVVAEMQDSNGSRWLRQANGDGVGNQLPSWQLRGYLGDALSYCDKVYDRLASEVTRPDEEV